MNKYILTVKENSFYQEVNIKAEDEENALYDAIDNLQLIKGIVWVKNSTKRINQRFKELEKKLNEGCACLGHGVFLKKVGEY